MSDIGYVDIESQDLTEQMMPMLHAFSLIGTFPLAVMRRLGKAEKAVNAMSGVEMYKYRGAWSYKVWSGRKPA
jgi:hypothetical protein